MFTAINLYQIACIYLERRPVVLSEDEQKLYDLGFRSLRPREFVFAVARGRVEDGRRRREGRDRRRAGVVPLHPDHQEGRSPQAGRAHRDVETGTLIGTALALTGDPSPVEMTFTEPARYIRWSLAILRSFLDNRPDLRATLQGLVNRDLVGKVERLLPA